MLCQAFAVSLGLWDEPCEPHPLAGSQREDSELLRRLADRTEVPLPAPAPEAPLACGELWPLLPVRHFLICPFHASLCSVTPIFTLSSVSGESLDLLKVFLNILPPLTNSKEQEELMQQLTEFQVAGHLNGQ